MARTHNDEFKREAVRIALTGNSPAQDTASLVSGYLAESAGF
jgi:hypothetical protein